MHRVMQAERVKSSQYPDEVTTNDVIEQGSRWVVLR